MMTAEPFLFEGSAGIYEIDLVFNSSVYMRKFSFGWDKEEKEVYGVNFEKSKWNDLNPFHSKNVHLKEDSHLKDDGCSARFQLSN
ncbi:hypothetical protein chiPu_0005357 [Chiloscyllium punctatum]|uniref:Uncharacterized protein n=1 Tax=Chiloscyllium punctatum TaxID=137246 RepID=A0A401S955_CHIPU|nr:hypothetical protein [Chiloscyllium punctatum]